MILEIPYDKGLYDENGIDYRYYGKDAEEFLKHIKWEGDIKYLGKECPEGIIIGVEESNSYNDYYFIAYDPKTGKVNYPLINNATFLNSIIV